MRDYIGFVDLAHSNIDVESLADQIDRAIDEFQPDFKRGITLRELGDRRRDVIAP